MNTVSGCSIPLRIKFLNCISKYMKYIVKMNNMMELRGLSLKIPHLLLANP